MIEAKLIAHSKVKHTYGGESEITTWLLTYPRFVHSEVMTHRLFSRNAASSRAIPFRKMASSVWHTPAIPEYWGANQKGMQASGELTPIRKWVARHLWKGARIPALIFAWGMHKLGLHKQLANRILEPWMHITVLMSTTDLGNFFSLRADKDAQPEFQVLAYRMLTEYLASIPTALQPGEWHIPLLSPEEKRSLTIEANLRLSVARAARTSYTTIEDGKPKDGELEDCTKLHDFLAKAGHWSPFEHQAVALDRKAESGNFTGWGQYRKEFSSTERRSATHVELAERLAHRPKWITGCNLMHGLLRSMSIRSFDAPPGEQEAPPPINPPGTSQTV